MTERIYYSKEAEALAKQQEKVRMAAILLLGLALGAVLALLFAPEEGQKTRRQIAQALEEGYRSGRDATMDALRGLEKEYPNLRQRVDRLINR